MQVFGPSVPILGMRPDMDKAMLGPGWFQLLKNFRCDTGLPVARNTETQVLVKPDWATQAAPLGSRSVSLNGKQFEVAVWSDGTKARVAVSPSSLTRWVEVTGTKEWTGPSGNNRLTSITAHCQMTVFRISQRITNDITEPDRVDTARDVVLIQNGEDYPRIWDPAGPTPFSYTVTSIEDNAGKFRLVIGAHEFTAGNHLYWEDSAGVYGGLWEVDSVTATKVTLKGSTYSALASGGTVYDRADLLVHKPVPDLSAVGVSTITCDHLSIAGGAGTTYPATADPLQTADFQFADSATAPYTGTNSVIDWDITTSAAAGDIAAVTFTNPITVGKQMVWLVEGTGALAALRQGKIEINSENVAYGSIATAWQTMYDPTGSEQTKKDFISIVEDSTANRYWVIFDTRLVAAGSYYHVRITRQGPAPAATQQVYILFMGAASGDLPATTQWGFHTEDSLNLVEQKFHVMTAKAENIGSLGGPKFVTTGTATVTTAAPTLPLVDTFFPLFKFTVPYATTASVTGGLDGLNEGLAIYAKLPGQDTYYWMASPVYYLASYPSSGVRGWSGSSSTDTVITFGATANYSDYDSFNFNRPGTSAFQLPIPIASVCEYINQRLFIGSTKEGTKYSHSDFYFSWDRIPYRFQQVQEDEFKGGYGQLAGERIMAFRFSASASLGAGRVFMFSDQWLYSLGESGPFVDAGLSSSEIGRPVRIGPHGTLSPRGPAIGRNALVWPDQDMQIMRLGPGGLENISRGHVSTRFETSVANRKAYISGAFWKDRFYFAYTPTGETTNERVLVFNERMNAWESEDYEAGATNFEQFHIWLSTPGVIYSTRLFLYDTLGTLFGYEEDSTGGVAVQFTTGSYNFNKWTSWYIKQAIMSATSQAVTGTLYRVSSKWGPAEPWSTTVSHNESGALMATYLDSVAHLKTGAERTELDWEWHLDYVGAFAQGSVIRRLEFEAQESNVTAGLGT